MQYSIEQTKKKLVALLAEGVDRNTKTGYHGFKVK